MDAKRRLPSIHREQVYINCGWIILLKGKIISLSGCKQIPLPSVSIIGLAASDQLKIYLTNISTSVSVLTHIEIKTKKVGWTFLKLARGNPFQNKPVLGHDCQFPYLFYLQLGVYQITINAYLFSPALLETDDILDYDLLDFTWQHDSVLTNFHHCNRWLSQYCHYLPHFLSYQITFCPVNAWRSI